MTCSGLAPTSTSHAPIEITLIRNADASSSTMTASRVAFEEVFFRFGCSTTTSGSAIVERPYNLRAARAQVGRIRAGVVKLADTPGLGPGAERLGGSSPSARTPSSTAEGPPMLASE